MDSSNNPQNPGEKANGYSEYNEYMAYLCDKTQRITMAIYRVTDLMPDREPLKWELREKAVSVFATLAYLRDKDFLEKFAGFGELEECIDRIILMLSIFPATMPISNLNFKVLKDEYLEVKKGINQEKHKNTFEEIFFKPVLNAPNFQIPAEPSGPVLEMPPAQISNGHSNGHPLSNGHNNGQEKKAFVRKENKSFPDQEKNSKSAKSSIIDRKKKILEIVKEKEKITVGELAAFFSGCSEKTIQRDLVEMADKGILRKEGDKRWRTYSFNKQSSA